MEDLEMERVLGFPSSLSSFAGNAVEMRSSHCPCLAGTCGSSACVAAGEVCILRDSLIFFMAMRGRKVDKNEGGGRY